jgi:hypothetical protein
LRAGGNKRLSDLLGVYEININQVKKDVLYSGKLLDFYRKLLKSEIAKDKPPQPPKKEEALTPSSQESIKNKENDKSKFSSVTNEDTVQDQNEENKGFLGHLNGWMVTAYDKTSNLAIGMKDSFTESKIGSKIVGVGTGAVDFIKDTGEVVLNKGTEVAVK